MTTTFRTEETQESATSPTADQTHEQEEAPAIPASAFADPGVHSPSRPASASGRFDDVIFEQGAATDGSPSPRGLFREASDPAAPEPVTQPVGVVPSSPAAAPSSPSAPSPSSSSSEPSTPATGERTLTRRELRAMLQAQEANQQANHTAPVTDAVFPVTFTPDADERPAAPKAPSTSPASAPDTSTKTAWPFSGGGTATPAPAPVAASGATPSGGVDTTVTQSATSAFTALGIPTPWKDEKKEPVETESPDAPAASPEERRPFTPPTGHWSTAAELDDKNAPVTSRNVAHSTAATTTNALILPSLPQADATGPLTSTGEILVTGSIDLPRALGATGAHPDHIDSADIDRLLDGEENEFNTSEVAPVRASRAISSHTSTRGVITPPKKRGNTLPIVLMVTAGVLAVGVIGLLVAAYVLHVF